MRDPFACYRDWKQRFGDTFMVNALNGDVVASCNRENIRRIFKASFDDVAPFAVDTVKPLVGGSSVFLIQGEAHRRERSVLSPPFHGKAMRNKAGEIRDSALRVAKDWQPGERIKVMDSSLEVSLEVIIRIVFGIQSEELIDRFKTYIKSFVSSFHPLLAFTRIFQSSWFGLSPWKKFTGNRDRFFELLGEQIALRRREGGNEDSVLSQLIQARYEDGRTAGDKSIQDQLVSMLLAGHETTQIAIAWAMSWLHRHPEYLVRLRESLSKDASIEAIMNDELLTGVCNESLRLNAIVSDTVRTLRIPMSWEDVELPAGTNVAIPICLVHEDPELYPDPLRFNPDRWQGASFRPHEYMPFGGGVRKCIGAPLAIMEMKIVIATWVHAFEFELPADSPDVEPLHRRNVTMAPKSGIPLVFRGKQSKTSSPKST